MVKIYSTTQCVYCQMAKEYFKSKNIAFEEYNVEQDERAAAEMVEKSQQMGVPVIDINGQIIIGFDKESINKALKDLA